MKTFLCVAIAVACVFLLAEGIDIGGEATCACPSIYDPVCGVKTYASPCDRDCDNAAATSEHVFNRETGKCDYGVQVAIQLDSDEWDSSSSSDSSS